MIPYLRHYTTFKSTQQSLAVSTLLVYDNSSIYTHPWSIRHIRVFVNFVLKEYLEAICFGNRILFWVQWLSCVQGKLNYTFSPITYHRLCSQRIPTWKSVGVRKNKTKAHKKFCCSGKQTSKWHSAPQTRIPTLLSIWKPILWLLSPLFEHSLKLLGGFLPFFFFFLQTLAL